MKTDWFVGSNGNLFLDRNGQRYCILLNEGNAITRNGLLLRERCPTVDDAKQIVEERSLLDDLPILESIPVNGTDTMNQQRKAFWLECGVFAAPLRAQLREQGFWMKRGHANRLSHFERDLRAITRLRVRGMLTPSEAYKAEHRVYLEISACIEPYE